MSADRQLLVVVAHPDDESFGCGSTILEAVHRGYAVAVCTASLGEAGEPPAGFDLAGEALGDIRHRELRAAAAVLGARALPPLGLRDSGWDGDPPPDSICGVPDEELQGRIAAVIDAEAPDAVLVLAGDDGHRDHLRLAAAVARVLADRDGIALYQWCLPNALMRRWADEVARLRPETAHLSLEIAALGTPADRISCVLDTSPHLAARRRAIAAHASQTSPYEGLSAQLAVDFLTADHLVRLG